MIRKIYNNKLVIYYIVIYAIRYKILMLLLSNSRFLQLLDKEDIGINFAYISNTVQHKEKIIGHIDKVIKIIFPNTKCLVSSLVKKSVLVHYGFQEKIFLGVKLKNEAIHAHAWLASERSLGHNKIELPYEKKRSFK